MHASKLPLYMQQEVSECGHACVAMLASYHGYEIDVSGVRERFGSCGRGLSLYEIRAMLDAFGLQGQALSVPLSHLSQLSLPCILHWNFDHFVVLKEVKQQRYWLHDPAIGIRVCTQAELSKAYTGIAFSVDPKIDFEKINMIKKLTGWHLLRVVSNLRGAMSVVFGLSLLVEWGQVIQGVLMQYVTDVVVGLQDTSNIVMMAVSALGILSLLLLLEYVRGRFQLFLSTQLKTQFSINTMRHLAYLPLSYFENRQVGTLQQTLHAVEEVQKKMGAEWIHTCTDFVFMLIHLSVMCFYSLWLTVIVCIGTGCVSGIRYLSFAPLKANRQMAFYAYARVASVFLEFLQTILPTKAYAKEAARWRQWRDYYVEAVNIETQGAVAQLQYQIGVQWLSQLEYILLVCMGAYWVGTQRLSLGMLVAFLSYRQAFSQKMTTLMQRILEYGLMRVELTRLQDLLVQSPEHITLPVGAVPACDGTLQLIDIAFQYDVLHVPLLQNLSCTVSAGEKVAIVGESGSGKSTLLKVMMALLQPSAGQLLIDHCPLAHWGKGWYRHWSASVLQDDHLMRDTIRANILFFETQYDAEWFHAVLEMTALDTWVRSLPLGDLTRLNEMGANLSGGQRQRVLLARALYKRPRFLFLDEATSHLDVKTERRVNDALKQLHMTQVIVAHRQETIAMADRVMILSEGKIQC